MIQGSPQNYGRYTLDSAQLLTLPQLTATGIDWFGDPPHDRLGGPDNGNGNGNGNGVKLKHKLANAFMVAGKRHQPIPPPGAPAVPPISSVAVMDVGQGNCNVLIDNNHEPVTYYDVGYPLWFFLASLPANMHAGNPAYLGPYQPNAGNNMNVVLSHWDWDHWRLGAVANLTHLTWTIPNQPNGPVAQNFVNTPGLNAQLYPPGAPTVATPNYTIYKCTPLPGAHPAALMNNSGLAIGVWTRFPGALPPPNWHRVMLTADANFNTLAGVVSIANPVFPSLVGITAVHHGSNNYGAPNNLPAPVPVYANLGRIAYSYGVSAATGAHPYGFPGAVAVGNYQAAGWTQERSTAEGPNIHVPPWPPPPPVVRGNVRMGDQTPLVGYPNTAFTNFPPACQLQ